MLDDFERFESEVFVSIEPHFINEDKMALSLSLIAQSKAQKLFLIWCLAFHKPTIFRCLLSS